MQRYFGDRDGLAMSIPVQFYNLIHEGGGALLAALRRSPASSSCRVPSCGPTSTMDLP